MATRARCFAETGIAVIPGPDDLPALPVEEVHERIRFLIDRIRPCYQPLVEKMSGVPADEDVVLDIRILPDRAYGIAALPQKIDATESVARCIKEALGYMRFEARPVTPMIVRYRIVVSMVPGGFKTVEVNGTFVEMVEDVGGRQK